MNGYTLEQIIGSISRFSLRKKTCFTQISKVFASVQADLPIRTELLRDRNNGSTCWVNMNLIPVQDSEERITHCVTHIHKSKIVITVALGVNSTLTVMPLNKAMQIEGKDG